MFHYRQTSDGLTLIWEPSTAVQQHRFPAVVTTSNTVPALAPATAGNGPHGTYLSFDVEGYSTLRHAIEPTLGRLDIFWIYRSLALAVLGARAAGVTDDEIVFSLDFIYVNRATGETRLIALPPGHGIGADERTVLRQIIANVHIDRHDETVSRPRALSLILNSQTRDLVRIEFVTRDLEKPDQTISLPPADVDVFEMTTPTVLARRSLLYDDMGGYLQPLSPVTLRPRASVTRLSTGQITEIKDGALTIGRRNGKVDVILQHPSVSRIHAHIYTDDLGQYWVVDNEATNGVLVNGVRISPLEPVALSSGDELQIGEELLRFDIGFGLV